MVQKRVTKKFKQAYQYDSSWKEAFLADLREMSHACQEEEEEGEERPREDPKLAFIQHRAMQPVPLLPYKLSGMNLKQAHTRHEASLQIINLETYLVA